MTQRRTLLFSSTLGGLAVGLAALVGIVATTFWLNERAQSLFTEVVAARDARGAAVELRNEVLAADANGTGYLVSGNEIYLSPYDRAKARALRQTGVVERLFAPYADMAGALERLHPVLDQKFAELDAALALKRGRDEEGALARFGTNRGKALMDEANVYLSGLIRAADARLTASAAQQRANAEWLRWIAIGGAVIVILFVGWAALAATRYTRQLQAARNEVEALNEGLEQRVAERTAALARARDQAELLVGEVNHRVANSLSLVASLVSLQVNATKDANTRDVLMETRARIDAVAQVHKKLYSSGDVRVVALDEYLSGLIDHLAQSLRGQNRDIEITHDLAQLELPTDESIGLGVIVTEWITNAAKYAYPQGAGSIRVRLERSDPAHVTLAVEDDGVGRETDAKPRGTGLGTRIVSAMAARLNAKAEYVARRPGTSARLILAMPQGATT